jgi:hypothetical protein
VLAGRHEACAALGDPRRSFVALTGIVDPAKARIARALLERHLRPHLVRMSQPIPPGSIAGQRHNYAEALPKTARVWTAYLDHPRAKAFGVAEELGLVAMMRSASFVAFAAAVGGRALRRRGGMQVLCYGAGDYAGPHNDHHPEEPEAAAGYVDVHVGLSGEAVAHQYLVYEQDGHLSQIVPVHGPARVNVYRLPFWHYTTPLVAKAGHEADARRWLLLGTFVYASPRAKAPGAVFPPPLVRPRGVRR